MTDRFVARRDLLGWNGERVLTGMTAPTDTWPERYVNNLVANGVLVVVPVEVPAEAPAVEAVTVDASGAAIRQPNTASASVPGGLA